MKQYRRNCILLLASSWCLGGCQAQQSSTSSADPIDAPETIYSDFNDWDTDFTLIRVGPTSGAVYLNEDPQYSRDGTGKSCLFRPLGSYSRKEAATFLFPNYSEKQGFDYRDYSKTKELVFDFYNAEDKELQVAVGLAPSIPTAYTNTLTKTVWQTLAAKAWTTITYQVDQTSLGFLFDVANIDGFYVQFANSGTRDEEKAPHVYLDNIKIERYIVAPPKGEGLRLEPMEFMNFEDPLQEMAIDVNGPADAKPEGGIVKATSVGLEAPSGDYIYSWTCHPSPKNTGSWSSVIFSSLVTQATILNQVDATLAKQLVLNFWVYNDTDAMKWMEQDFLYADQTVYCSLQLKPKTWMKFSLSMEEALTKFEGFAKGGKLRFVYPEYTEKEDYHFYFDNFYFSWASETHPGSIEY